MGGWKNINVSLRKLLQQVLSEPKFYGDLVNRIRNIVGKSNFAEQFRKLINRYVEVFKILNKIDPANKYKLFELIEQG